MEIFVAFTLSIAAGGVALMGSKDVACYTAIPLALGVFGFVMALFELRRR